MVGRVPPTNEKKGHWVFSRKSGTNGFLPEISAPVEVNRCRCWQADRHLARFSTPSFVVFFGHERGERTSVNACMHMSQVSGEKKD